MSAQLLLSESRFVGFRHHPGCNCGCQLVVGVEGTVDTDGPDARALAKCGVAYVAFQVPSETCGPPSEHVVAYTLEELAA